MIHIPLLLIILIVLGVIALRILIPVVVMAIIVHWSYNRLKKHTQRDKSSLVGKTDRQLLNSS